MVTEGQRHHEQKRLVLCNIKEAYQQFKVTHPGMDIGFSKFAELRPKQCVIAGGSGTHSVCVCTTHQNTKLMFRGAKIDSVTDGKYSTYHNCLAALQCNHPNISCCMGTCEECPGSEKLRESLDNAFENQMTH